MDDACTADCPIFYAGAELSCATDVQILNGFGSLEQSLVASIAISMRRPSLGEIKGDRGAEHVSAILDRLLSIMPPRSNDYTNQQALISMFHLDGIVVRLNRWPCQILIRLQDHDRCS